jgi:hypothetical protein
MAFGQSSGPPATGKQVQRLEALLQEAGHADFRDARGPLGLNQRQAAGRFTRDEADALIERLEREADGLGPSGPPAEAAPPEPRTTRATRQLRDVPDDVLAAELQRRGWVVMEP